MKNIYEAIKQLEEQAIQRKEEAEKANESTEWDDGYLEALIDIETWVDTNKRDIESPYGYIFTVINAED